jgi:hypothetical protein
MSSFFLLINKTVNCYFGSKLYYPFVCTDRFLNRKIDKFDELNINNLHYEKVLVKVENNFYKHFNFSK